ncbi:MAG: segregation/condensation protein A [Euryarchaeota archaeon]|nr:segregation/condensation protein A [Euryarchaeota archaeon]
MQHIEILIDLVTTNQLDIWQVDIIEIADKFTERINQMEKLDLRISAKTLLTASILLRMKSEILVQEGESLTRSQINEILSGTQEAQIDEIAQLFGQYPGLQNLVEATQVPLSQPIRGQELKRKITFFELLESLQKSLNDIRSKALKSSIQPKTIETEGIIADVMEELGNRVKLLLEHILSLNSKTIKFSELIKQWTPKEVVKILLPLLFLANQKRVKISQSEWCGEIYITLGESNA